MKTRGIFIISVIIFVLFLFLIPNNLISSDLGNTVLTITAFLFGIIAGFYIVVTTTDYNNVKNILAAETAGWISLYQNVLTYDKPAAEKLVQSIDNYIRSSFDFEIIDYAKSTQVAFADIQKIINNLPLKNDLSYVYQVIRGINNEIIKARQQLLVLGAKTLSFFQWSILFTLSVLLVFSLYGLRSGQLFFDIVTVAISASVILILFLIRDLDLYIWNEKTFGYDIFENVLTSLGLLPYYPKESLDKGRVHPLEKEYRLGTYLNYPKTLERKIEIHKAD